MSIELAWAAGFYDGDGCLSFVKVGGHRRPRDHRVVLTITQKDIRPLERFVAAVGGGGYMSRNSRGHHQWTIVANQALAVYGLIAPYVSAPKREQAQRVLLDLVTYQHQARLRMVEGWRSRKDLPLERRSAG